MMLQVTKEAFYAALSADKRDIMPTIVSGYDRATGYTSEWRTNAVRGELFGKSDNGDGGRYWLCRAEAA